MQPSLERLLEEDDFTVWSPGVDIIEKAGEDVEVTRPIGGWCSTENLDRQDEVVVANGLDFSEFVSFGHFNDNHKQDTSAVLGYPRLAKLEKSRWWTEGNLLVGYGPSDKIWELAKALKKSNAPRRLGFSIEGKVLQRDTSSNRIVRAKVRNVAITNCPVNTDCSWDILGKAFAPAAIVEEAKHKALAAGHALRLNAGGALRTEDLEHGVRTLQRHDDLSFEEAVGRLQQIRPHLSKAACHQIVRFAMCR